MKSDIKSVVGTPGFRPTLRQGLRFYRDAAAPGIVIVHDPVRDSKLQLYEVECLIAKQMDGTRDLEAIARAAKPHVPWATRDHIEKLAVQIAGMGLLANSALPSLPRVQGTPLLITAQSPGDEELDAEALLSDRTTLDPTFLEDDAAQFDDSVNTALAPANATFPPPAAWSAGLAARIDAAMGAPFGAREQVPLHTPVPGPNPLHTPVPNAPSIAPEPPGPPEALISSTLPAVVPPMPVPVPSPLEPEVDEPAEEPEFPPPATARPQPDAEEPWVVERTPWHKRRWFRRLRYLAVPALVIGLLALIPYPLYVTEPCVVVPSKKAHVRAAIDGLIAEIFVGEGDLVEAGAPLARLDDREVSFELQKAEAELQRLKSNLAKQTTGSRPEEIRKAEAHVRTAANDVHYAKINVKRKKDLLKNGVGSIQERDDALRDLALKSSLLSEAYAELRLVRAGSRTEEVEIAEAEVRRAEAEVEHFQKHRDRLLIKAPIAGRVLTPRFRERIHEKLKAGDLVAEIGDMQTVRLEIEVPEREADVVQVGQPVTLKVHSLPLKAFDGRVTFIAPAVEGTKDGGRILRVDAQLLNDESLLQAGMTGYAEIDAGERTVLGRMTRRAVRWVRVRFLL